MSNKASVPDAWDDDWEAITDKSAVKPPHEEQPPKITKSQRRAQHKEQQRQLWDSAENPDRFHWLEAQGVVPLKNEFKPQVTLLSRKPGVTAIAKKSDGVTNGVAGMSLNDDDEDSEEESRKKREAELEERTRKAKIEREEKQKRYAEARERIMGSPSSTPTNGTSGAAAAAAARSRESSHGRDNRRSRGNNNTRGSGNRGSQPASSTDQSPARAAGGVEKTLFDPDDMGRRVPKREAVVTTPREDHPTRQPQGPERGGFGFGNRGGQSTA